MCAGRQACAELPASPCAGRRCRGLREVAGWHQERALVRVFWGTPGQQAMWSVCWEHGRSCGLVAYLG